jgi:hypothetical protein
MEPPPMIDTTIAAYVGVIATILIGIFFTKDDKRNFENIVSNIVSFALLLATVEFTWLALIFMAVYLIAGIFVAVEKKRKYFFLFGSKTYGSIALMILLIYDGFFGFKLAEIEFPITVAKLEYLGIMVLGWFILALIAHATGYFYWRKASPKKKSTDGAAASLKAWFRKRSKGKSRKRGQRRKSTRKRGKRR